MGKKLNNKLECPKCHTIYLTLTQNVEPKTPIHGSSCGTILARGSSLSPISSPKVGKVAYLKCAKGRSFAETDCGPF